MVNRWILGPPHRNDKSLSLVASERSSGGVLDMPTSVSSGKVLTT
jgi:hypothetical protein